MKEKTMCCGTTCDNKNVADYIEKLINERDALAVHVTALTDCLDCLIEASHGVSGLHMNGDLAPWDELTEGGRFEEWLLPFSQTPAISLAEVQAQAVLEFADSVQRDSIHSPILKALARHYANRICKEG